MNTEYKSRCQSHRFWPPDASALGEGGYCYGDVAVCVSLALMYCALTTESIIVRPTPDRRPAVLVLPYQLLERIRRTSPLPSGKVKRSAGRFVSDS